MEAIRNINASILVPFMNLTGFRFSKHYRWGTTKRHALVYMFVNTVKANSSAK